MTRIGVALFNYERGGRTADGGYDMWPLQKAFAGLKSPPALIMFCLTDRGARPAPVAWGFAQRTCSRR
jgi:hypothetical protein